MQNQPISTAPENYLLISKKFANYSIYSRIIYNFAANKIHKTSIYVEIKFRLLQQIVFRCS